MHARRRRRRPLDGMPPNDRHAGGGGAFRSDRIIFVPIGCRPPPLCARVRAQSARLLILLFCADRIRSLARDDGGGSGGGCGRGVCVYKYIVCRRDPAAWGGPGRAGTPSAARTRTCARISAYNICHLHVPASQPARTVISPRCTRTPRQLVCARAPTKPSNAILPGPHFPPPPPPPPRTNPTRKMCTRLRRRSLDMQCKCAFARVRDRMRCDRTRAARVIVKPENIAGARHRAPV